ncbi:MAG: GspE/PulE family protein, partial [Opitutales bacterium]
HELGTAALDLAGDALDRHLIEHFKLTEVHLLLAKGRAFDLPPFNARHAILNERSFGALEPDFCVEHQLLPLGETGGHYMVAITDPFDRTALQKVQEKVRLPVVAMLALPEDVAKKLSSFEDKPTAVGFGDVMESLNLEFDSDSETGEISEDDLEEESAPIILLASRIVEESYLAGASDIHIDPFENETRIRVRVDGVCQEKLVIPSKVSAALLARLKVMANLDIAEKRLPQDGRIVYKQFNRKGIDVDLRVSTAPLNHGEGAVMRILDKQKSTLPLPALGFSEANLGIYRELIQRPYGMVLHCGPTGSGKSMTLYSALNEINSPEVCTRTAEDPIEYTLPGLCQMQMNRKIGLTFANALRSFLRQDPDIILVGEIRDRETAGIAVEAALTGHMLFSTLHTNDAPSTISRLTEMGIEPFMISASLVCVCAQRLLRRLCKTCKQAYEAEGRELELLERAWEHGGRIFRAKSDGCPACGGIGYKGRVGIHELMQTSEDLVRGINAGYETAVLKKIAIHNGMKTLHQDALLKVFEGLTSLEEAVATIPPDMEDLRAIMGAASLEELLGATAPLPS